MDTVETGDPEDDAEDAEIESGEAVVEDERKTGEGSGVAVEDGSTGV